MDNEKEKDEIQEMFSRQLEAMENRDDYDNSEEKKDDKPQKVHFTEVISPIVAIIICIISCIFSNYFWYGPYFGLIFAFLGIYMCHRKGDVSLGIRILNVVAVALCFFLGGLWVIMYISKMM